MWYSRGWLKRVSFQSDSNASRKLGGLLDVLDDVRHHVREARGEDDAAGEAREARDEHPPALGPLPPTVRRHSAAVLASRLHRRGGSHAPFEIETMSLNNLMEVW